MKCSSHDDDLRYYCGECDNGLCLECSSTHSKTHKLVSLTDLVEDQLEKMILDLEDKICTMQIKLNSEKKKHCSIPVNCRMVKQIIQKSFENIRSILNQREKSLLDQCDDHHETLKRDFNTVIENEKTQKEAKITELIGKLRAADAVEIAIKRSELNQSFREAIQMENLIWQDFNIGFTQTYINLEDISNYGILSVSIRNENSQPFMVNIQSIN